jgi:hypothetical protein
MGRNIVVCLTLGSLGGGVYAGAGFAVLANSWLPSPSQTVTVPGALHIFHGTKNTVYSVHVDKGAIPVIYGEQLSYAPMSAKKYREIATRLGGSGSQSDSTHGRFEVRVNRGFFNVPFISDVKPVGP